MARVELEKVRKVYDDEHVAVEGADIQIEDGEFVVLVGPSGCGKSTTLRMIAGLESISSGTLRIGERVVNDVPPKERDIAMVFQNYALYPHMSVYDNMAFGLKLRKYPTEEIDERVRDAARILGLEEVLMRKPKQLSGGQRQRVAVGRAIVRKPKVFLFDEPLSNLDAKLRVQMRTEITDLHRRLQATMVYVTHDQVEAMTMGDRIVVLKDGIVQQIDTPLGLYNRPANRFVAGFIGSPSMNFIEGEIVDEDGRRFVSSTGSIELMLPEAWQGQDALAPGRETVLGVRPEDIYLAGSVGAEGRDVSGIELMMQHVEPMGSELVAYFDDGEEQVVARLEPVEPPEPPVQMKLSIDRARLHFFDPATEEAIARPVDDAAVPA